MRLFSVSGRECVRKRLGSHAIDARDVVRVGDCGVPSLNAPHGLAQRAYRGGGVEDNLRAVQTKRLPVERMMTTVTDVHRDLTESRLENRVARVALPGNRVNRSTAARK